MKILHGYRQRKDCVTAIKRPTGKDYFHVMSIIYNTRTRKEYTDVTRIEYTVYFT